MPEKLKKGWASVAFGDVVRQVRDRADPEDTDLERYVAGEHMDTDDLRIRRWGLIGDGYLGPAFHMRFKPGHVLYGSRRTYLRKVAVADFEGITANTTFVLESKDPKTLLPELLPFIMQTESFHEHSIKQSKGSVNPYINFSDLTWYEFALPPMEEQRRIAEMLGYISGLYEHLTNCFYKAAEILSAMYFVIFSRMHKDNSVEKRPLGNLLAEDICNGIFRKREQFGSGMRMINVTDCYLDFEVPIESLERVSVDRKEYDSFSARPGDVIFNRSSLVLSGIGHACIVPDTEEEMVFECHLMRVRPDVNEISSRYLTHYALSPHGRRYLLARAQTTTMTTINQGDLRNMLIPCPHIDVQKQLAAQFDQVLSLRRLLFSKRHRVSKLVRSFARNLLVPLDGELT